MAGAIVDDPGAQTVDVEGRRLRLTHLDRELYPATGTTKAEVIAYYVSVAPILMPLLSERIVVRQRFPDGVEAEGFYERNAPSYLPEWVRVLDLPHGSGTTRVRYPMVDELATLVWLAGHSAIELHTPQWRVLPDTSTDDPRGPVDRLVIDLDPGEGATLPDCAEVAQWVREHLDAAGMPSVPVTSGSKGMQVYARWPAEASVASSELARELAEGAERAFPGRVVSRMTKAMRTGRVLLDWSQNNPAKTTVCPYSLRARPRPTVACPRWWDEIDDPALAQVELGAMAERFADGDPMDQLAA